MHLLKNDSKAGVNEKCESQRHFPVRSFLFRCSIMNEFNRRIRMGIAGHRGDYPIDTDNKISIQMQELAKRTPVPQSSIR